MAVPTIVSKSSTTGFVTDALISIPFPEDAASTDYIVLAIFGDDIPDPTGYTQQCASYDEYPSTILTVLTGLVSEVVAETIDVVNSAEGPVAVVALCVRGMTLVEFPPRNGSYAAASTSESSSYTESGTDDLLLVAVWANTDTDFPVCGITPTGPTFTNEYEAAGTANFAALLSATYNSTESTDTLAAGSTDATASGLAWISLQEYVFIPDAATPTVRIWNGVEWV